jgi:hypothetical protein
MAAITLSATPRGNGYQATVALPDGIFVSPAETYPSIAEAVTAAAIMLLDMPERPEALDRVEAPVWPRRACAVRSPYLIKVVGLSTLLVPRQDNDRTTMVGWCSGATSLTHQSPSGMADTLLVSFSRLSSREVSVGLAVVERHAIVEVGKR